MLTIEEWDILAVFIQGCWNGLVFASITATVSLILLFFACPLRSLRALGLIYEQQGEEHAALSSKTDPIRPEPVLDCTETAKWLNYLSGDILHALAGGRLVELCQESVVEGIDERLAMLQKGEARRLLVALKLTKFSLGKRLPVLKRIATKSTSDELVVMFDFRYDGGAAIQLKAQMGLGMRDLDAKLEIKPLAISRLVLKMTADNGNPRIAITMTAMPPFSLNLMYGVRRLGRVSTLLHVLMTSVLLSRMAVFPRQKCIVVKKNAADIRSTFETILDAQAEVQARVKIIGGQVTGPLQKSWSTSSLASQSSSEFAPTTIYCIIAIGDKSERTKAQPSPEPKWNAVFTFGLDEGDKEMKLQIYQRRKRLSRSELLVESRIDLAAIPVGESQAFRLVMESNYIDIELAVSRSQDIKPDIDGEWIFAGLPSKRTGENDILREDERVLERFNWSNVKYVLDRIRTTAKAEKQQQTEHEKSIVELVEEDLIEELRESECIESIPSAQQQHINQIISDWDEHFEGEEPMELRTARSMLEILQREVSGTATPYKHSLSEGLKPTPVVRAMVPTIKEQISSGEDLFLSEVVKRLEELNGESEAVDLSCCFGIYRGSLNEDALLLAKRDADLNVELEEGTLDFVPELDVFRVCQHDEDGPLASFFPSAIYALPVTVITGTQLTLDDQLYECKSIQDAMVVFSFLASMSIASTLIPIKSITGMRLVYELDSPVGLHLRTQQDIVLTGDYLIELYSKIRLQCPDLQSLDGSTLAFTPLERRTTWLPHTYPQFACSLTRHRSVYRGMLSATSSHLLFHAIKSDDSVNVVLPFTMIRAARIARRTLFTKGILVELKDNLGQVYFFSLRTDIAACFDALVSRLS